MNLNDKAEKVEEKDKDESEEDDECLLDASTESIGMDATWNQGETMNHPRRP